MPKLTARQRSLIKKRTRVHELDPSEVNDELNIVPFLDIVVNLIMFLLMTITAVAFFSQVEAQLPEYSRGGVGRRAAEAPPLNLNVTIVADGVIVAGSGGKLTQGCESTGTGRVITVPRLASGGYDWEGLTRCAEHIKERFPEEERVTLGADPLVEYEHLIHAMDSMRGSEETPLFPEVLLSAGLRQ